MHCLYIKAGLVAGAGLAISLTVASLLSHIAARCTAQACHRVMRCMEVVSWFVRLLNGPWKAN